MQMKSLIFEVCAYVFHYIRLKMENCKFLLVNDGLWLSNEMIFFYQAVEFAYTTVVQTNMVDKQKMHSNVQGKNQTILTFTYHLIMVVIVILIGVLRLKRKKMKF
jgi:hypothetical protein